MRIERALAFFGLAGLLLASCNVNPPFDPSSVFRPLDDAFENAEQFADNLVEDPLGSKPFPVICGGDNSKVFYATNLGDVRINFSGPTNDLVFPLFDGPSNLYSIENKTRDLVRPLVPTSAAFGLITDGDSFAYLSYDDPFGQPIALISDSVYYPASNVVFQSRPEEGTTLTYGLLALDQGRLAFGVSDQDSQTSTLHVEDLNGTSPGLEIETNWISAMDLKRARLAYAGADLDGVFRVHLRDLSSDTDTVVAELQADARVWSLALTENRLFWAELVDYGRSGVLVYDIPTMQARVWADSAAGTFVGANDEYFVTEEYTEREDGALLYTVRRFDQQGREKKLATFRADGLAGQATVLGDRVVWVNSERKIVIAPLAGGDRLSFRPY